MKMIGIALKWKEILRKVGQRASTVSVATGLATSLDNLPSAELTVRTEAASKQQYAVARSSKQQQQAAVSSNKQQQQAAITSSSKQ